MKLSTPVKCFFWGLLLFILCCGQRIDSNELEQGSSIASSATISDLERPSQDNEKATVAVIYRTKDLGRSWEAYAEGLPSEATVSGFIQVADDLLAITDFHGVYRNAAGQEKWQPTGRGLPQEIDLNCILQQNGRLIVGTLHQGIFVSDDKGHSWTKVPGLLNEIPIRAFYLVNDRILAGTDRGIYHSMDAGNSWQPTFSQLQILGFSGSGAKVYAATQDGALMSQDGGQNWQRIYEGDALHDIYYDGLNVYAMTLGRGLLRSNDDGQSWENVQNQMGTPNLYTFEMQRVNGQLFAAQWYGVFRSSNRGNYWELISSLPDSTAFASFFLSEQVLYAGAAMR